MVADFKQKQKKARVFRIAFAFGGIAVVGVALLLVVADINIYNKKKALRSQVEDLQNKIRTMEQENEDLEKGITESENEVYIEKIAREDLNLQKKGEKVVSFIMPEDKLNTEADKKETLVGEWFAWLSAFFSNN